MKAIPVTLITYSYRSNPDLPPIPIGVIAFGGHESEVFWAHVNKANAGDRYGRDEIEKFVMNNMPGWFRLIKDGIDSLAYQLRESGIVPDMMKIIHEVSDWSKGASLSVSAVDDIEVQVGQDFAAGVMAGIHSFFESICRPIDGDEDEQYECGLHTEVIIPKETFLN